MSSTTTSISITIMTSMNPNMSRGLVLNLSTESWIIYSGGIISGVVLLELLLVLLMVICRRCQIRRKERNEQEHIYHVRRGERWSNLFDFTGKFTSRSSRSTNQNTCVVSEVEPEPMNTNISNNAITDSPTGSDETAAYCDDHTSKELNLKQLKRGEVRVKKQATELQLEHPKIIIEDPILVGPNCSYGTSPSAATNKTTRVASNFSTGRQLSLGDENTKGQSRPTRDGEMESIQKSSKKTGVLESSKKTGVLETSLSVDHLQVVDRESKDIEQAYEELDELEKQINILSQSIPMLDVFGNEIVKPTPPAPKISRSIPTLLDMAGYEDVDAVRQNQARASIPKTRKPAMVTEQPGVDVAGYEDLDALRPKQRRKTTTEQLQGNVGTGAEEVAASTSGHDKSPPLVSTHTMDKDVDKKQSAVQAAGENKEKTKEPVYSVVQKKPKAFSVSDLTEEQPPPVPPMTAEALYIAVQKPKKKTTTRYYSAVLTDESLPYLGATRYMRGHQGEENPPIKASISMEQILKEEASRSCTLALVQPKEQGDDSTLHTQHHSSVKTTYPRTYIYEDELQTDL